MDRRTRAWLRVARVALVQTALTWFAVLVFPWVGMLLWLVTLNGIVAYLELRILRAALRPVPVRPSDDPRWGWPTDETERDRVRRQRQRAARAWQRRQQLASMEARLHRDVRRELRRAARAPSVTSRSRVP